MFMTKSPKKENHHRKYWVWVADQRSYLDEDGNDHPNLDPVNESAAYSSWTCHKNTRKGDLALLYRSRRAKDIGYLIQANSDAYQIFGNKIALENGWNYECECSFIYKFRNSLTISEMRAMPYLQDWSAYRGNFQQMVYEIPSLAWKRLSDVFAERNRGYKTFLSRIERSKVADYVLREEHIEEILIKDLRRLRKFDFWRTTKLGACDLVRLR